MGVVADDGAWAWLPGQHGAHEHASYGWAAAMWLVMTAVMMTPVVAPWLRALATMARASDNGPAATLSVPAFMAGYALAWSAFALSAAAAQIWLQHWTAAAGSAFVDAPALMGGGLVLAGAFQFTRLKEACLTHCRSPMGYLLAHWRPGTAGTARLGFRHGLFCLGCCWALMGLALVVGAMELGAMALLMAVMLLETLAPFGHRLVRPVGAAAVLAGLALIVL